MTNRTAQRKKQAAKREPVEGPVVEGRTSGRASGGGPRAPMFAIGAVVAIVIAMVGLSVYNHARTPATPGESASEKVIAAVTTVPSAVLDEVGVGEGVAPPTAIGAGAPEVTADGKPEVLYIGAEYCPYCAAQRWPLVVALSRFGTFSGLGLSTSSATDVFPSTPTVTFHGSTYASDVLSFSGVETNTNQPDASGTGYEPLEHADARAATAHADVRRAAVHLVRREHPVPAHREPVRDHRFELSP